MRAIGGIVDSAATAEIFNVLTSRSKESLRALVPATAFEDRAALAEHLAEHIVGKGTTQDISLEIASYGGPDSFYRKTSTRSALAPRAPTVKSMKSNGRRCEPSAIVNFAISQSNIAYVDKASPNQLG